jgi:O-antigen/teichoic acid export membrane protein
MDIERKIAKNAALQVLGKGFVTLFGILTVAVLARALGAEGYGSFTLIITFLSVFATLVDFGLTLTTTQMISEDGADEKALLGNLVSLRLISGILFLGAAPILAIFFPYSGVEHLGIAIGSISYLFGTTSQLFTGLFQKRLKMGYIVAAEFASRATIFGLTALFAFLSADILAFIWVLVIGNGLQLLITVFAARSFTELKPQINLATWKTILGRTWPIGLSIFFNLIYLKGDIVFLSIYRSTEEIGIYGAAYKIVDVLTIIPTLYMGLILPMLVAAWSAHNHEAFRARLQQTFDLFALAAIPIAAGGILLGVPLMEFVAGSEFSESGEVLKYLVPASSIVFFGALFGHAVVGLQKQRIMTIAYAIVAILTIIGYMLLIPVHGIYGAAWMTVFAELLITLITGSFVLSHSGLRPNLSRTLQSIGATLIMAAALLFLPEMHVLLAILAGMVVFFAALPLLGGPHPKKLIGLLKP